MTYRAIFAGKDASGLYNLWVTDGTSAGTTELTVPTASSGGLFSSNFVFSPDFTALGRKTLFAGFDAHGSNNLWVTDGTSAGTTELAVAGGYSGGLFGSTLVTIDLTVFGKRALFAGYNAKLTDTLWVTDGTSAGTSELVVAGANFFEGLFGGGGAYGPEFTVLGGKALFQGDGPNYNNGLWVTDGTSAGTSELNVTGANPLGLFVEGPGGVLGVHNPAFAVLGGRVIFNGSDAGGRDNLWVTDGTAAGTTQLTFAGSGGLFAGVFDGFAVLGSKALFAGINNLWVTDGTSAGTRQLAIGEPYDITVLGTKALGADAAGNLWISDGTSAGTSELAGPYFRDSQGRPITPNFIAFGDKALFYDNDASGNSGLWVTDGTAAGTKELTVKDADVDGLAAQNFAVVGTKVLFEGLDKAGAQQLWVTDGSSEGTSELAVSNAYAGGLAPRDITPLPTPPVTIATNGVTSLVQIGSQYELEAVSSGTGPVLTYGGSTVTVGEFPGWTPVGAEKTATGYQVAWSLLGVNEYSVWNTDSNGAYTGAATGALSGASYALQHLKSSFREDLNGDRTIGPTITKPPATSDFNKDGLSDILWQNIDGQASIWDMNGNTLIGGGAVSSNPGPNWHAVGTGDFNHDGHSDILWQNANGQASIWDMNGNNLIGGGAVSPNPGPAWKAIGTGDFTGDGFSDDILWQNANGQAAIWEMNGNTLKGGGPVSPNPRPSWRAVGTGDFNGDGDSDILWQNANGQVSIWEMNGNSLMGGGPVSPNPGPNWKALGTGDFNGDGLSDILFQNTSTGQVSIWDMNGNKLIGGGPVSPNPGPAWKAIGTGDFNGDGLPDILFQNTSSGQASIWDMSGTRLVGGGPVSPNPGPSWHATA